MRGDHQQIHHLARRNASVICPECGQGRTTRQVPWVSRMFRKEAPDHFSGPGPWKDYTIAATDRAEAASTCGPSSTACAFRDHQNPSRWPSTIEKDQ